MTDTYQAVYDAVRSRMGSIDVHSACEMAIRNAFDGASHHMVCIAETYRWAAEQQARPSAIYRPEIKIDGNKWMALYGENIQDGVAGFGDSPSEAMAEFDKAWDSKLHTARAAAAGGEELT